MLQAGVHAATDVTGFGLTGHLLELLKASGVGAELYFKQIPVLPEAWALARQEVIPEGSRNNYHFVRDSMDWQISVSPDAQIILSDAQTSGGLLIAVAPAQAEPLLGQLRAGGNAAAQVIGQVVAAPTPIIRVL